MNLERRKEWIKSYSSKVLLGCATDLFIEMTEAGREFGVRLTSLNEYVQKVLASTPVP